MTQGTFHGIDSESLTTQADPHVLAQIDSWLKGKDIWFWVDLWFNSESYPCLDSTIISRNTGFIAKVSFCLDKSATRQLYNSLIFPYLILNYFVCSWDQIMLLRSTSYQLQKRTARMIGNIYSFHSYEPQFNPHPFFVYRNPRTLASGGRGGGVGLPQERSETKRRRASRGKAANESRWVPAALPG